MHFSVTCIRNDEKYDMHHQALLIFNKKNINKSDGDDDFYNLFYLLCCGGWITSQIMMYRRPTCR